MRILELRCKNLNSLYGEWTVDFTDPEYAASGIFALTGPTGAGKTTILDAICLALYGATPRLGKITKSSNEIMSRQTGECYAEVVFEAHNKRFRCHWEQRRARKKPDGRLQDPEHQIVDANTGQIIESKKSRVGDVIEDKTGMDFDRFTRSILLAQGGFDTFLKADAEHKSKILEQITGTSIYSAISCRVHERHRDEQEKLKLLTAETAGIVILEPEQEKEIVQQLAVKEREEAEITHALRKTGEAIIWRNTIENLKKELHDLAEEAIQLEADTKAFTPLRISLESANKAASLDGIHATVTALRREQTEDQTALKNLATALPKQQLLADAQIKNLNTAEQQTIAKKEELKSIAPLCQKIRLLDQALAEQEKVLEEISAACANQTTKINADKEILASKYGQKSSIQKTREDVCRYLEDNSDDEWLAREMAGIREQLKNLFTRQQEIDRKNLTLQQVSTAVAKAGKKEETAAKQHHHYQQAVDSAAQKLQQAQELLQQLLEGKLLREYRTEKENLLKEIGYIKSIANLTQQRTKLEDGKPCPLCGATEHPFAESSIPAPDDIKQRINALDQRINRAEKGEVVIKQLESTLTTTREQLNASEKLVINAGKDKQAAENAAKELEGELVRLKKNLAEERQSIQQQFNAHGLKMDITSPADVINILQSKIEKWQNKNKEKEEIKQQIAVIDTDIKRLQAVIETQQQSVTDQQEKLQLIRQKYAARKDERKTLFGNKDPDTEENRLNTAILSTEQNEKEARKLHDKLLQKLTAATADINLRTNRIQQRTTELEEKEQSFKDALTAAEFSNEQAFLAARLSNNEREVLSLQAKKLDHAQTELKAKQQDRQARLAVEQAKNITDKPLTELEKQHKEQEEHLHQLRNIKAELNHKLKENNTAQQRVKEQQSAIEKQRREVARFAKLHTLIGSADGKKYRNFAQGLTFERMVSHANRQLAKMTDRYLLIRDDQQPLELNVVDNYQAGEIRSTQNLSGGESFIVSLTLALGLSQMASQKVRVDSLFLDEGFGTLDKETLETAVETLSGLQQEGKLIGIISHIPALQERIRAQLVVSPNFGGRSVLSGPGVKGGKKK